MLTFNPPDKLVVVGDGSDAVMFTALPLGVHISTLQLGAGGSDSFVHDEASLRATFNPPGTYRWTLSYEGYEEATFLIQALAPLES